MNISCLVRLTLCLLLLLVCTSCLSGCATHHTRFTAAGNELNGTLTLPKNVNGPVPVAIFVHGDGPADADYYGYYRSFWQILADRGIASYSWDKPGVGDSSGNWLDQDMNDRAAEVVAAANHLARQPAIDAEQIGVIGFSQAGWVLPRLASEPWLDYLVFVSTAVNWAEQGNYLMQTRWGSRARTDPEDYQDAIDRDRQINALFGNNDAAYADYLELLWQLDGPDAGNPMSPARFMFAKKNVNEDATDALRKIRVPVLALFGEDDLNVDVENTLSVYSHVFNSAPVIDYTAQLFPGATHQLTKSRIFNEQVPGLWPVIVINVLENAVFVEGVLEKLAGFVAKQSNRREH